MYADSYSSQAGHVQDGPAPVMDDAAREEADPSRGGSAENASPAAAVTSSGKTSVSDLTCVCVRALTAPAPLISNQATAITTTTTTTTLAFFTTITTFPSWRTLSRLCHSLVAP